MSRTVTIVLDPDFGDELHELALRTAVWIVETETNRAAAEEAWRRAVEWPNISVTVFRSAGLPHLLEQVELHHGPASQARPFSLLEVVGAALTDEARGALAEAGFAEPKETPRGFRALKRREE